MRHVHVTPSGGTAIVDENEEIIAVATSWRHAADIVHAINLLPVYEHPKVDGMECVAWIKNYRNAYGVPLRTAKDEWDKRLASQS